MKIVKASLVAAIALVGSSAAMAQSVSINSNFSVTTEVLKFCKVSTQNIVIASITAGNTTGDKSNTGGVSVNCTNQTGYTLGVTDTLSLKHATTDYLIPTKLALNQTSGTGAGFGTGLGRRRRAGCTEPGLLGARVFAPTCRWQHGGVPALCDGPRQARHDHRQPGR